MIKIIIQTLIIISAIIGICWSLIDYTNTQYQKVIDSKNWDQIIIKLSPEIYDMQDYMFYIFNVKTYNDALKISESLKKSHTTIIANNIVILGYSTSLVITEPRTDDLEKILNLYLIGRKK